MVSGQAPNHSTYVECLGPYIWSKDQIYGPGGPGGLRANKCPNIGLYWTPLVSEMARIVVNCENVAKATVAKWRPARSAERLSPKVVNSGISPDRDIPIFRPGGLNIRPYGPTWNTGNRVTRCPTESGTPQILVSTSWTLKWRIGARGRLPLAAWGPTAARRPLANQFRTSVELIRFALARARHAVCYARVLSSFRYDTYRCLLNMPWAHRAQGPEVLWTWALRPWA